MAIFSSYFDITRGYWFILDHRFDASLQDVAGHFKDLIKMQDKELRDLRQEVPFIMAQSNSRISWADVRNWDSWDSWSICWRYFMISQDHFTNNALHILQMCWIAEPLIFRCVKPKKSIQVHWTIFEAGVFLAKVRSKSWKRRMMSFGSSPPMRTKPSFFGRRGPKIRRKSAMNQHGATHLGMC